MEKEKTEYYILAGNKGMKEVLIKHKIEITPLHLLIVSSDSKLGNLIKKEAMKQMEKQLELK